MFRHNTLRTLQSTIRLLLSLGLSTLMPTTSMHAEEELTDDLKAYASEVEIWRDRNEQRLRAPDGWLALTGHYWLSKGLNQIGTSKDSAVQVPENHAFKIGGHLTLSGDPYDADTKVTLHCDPESSIRLNNQVVSDAELKIDSTSEEADGSDTLTIGDRFWLQLVRRAGRLAVRVRDRESRLIRTFQGKRWYPVRPEYRVEAAFTPYEPMKSIRIVNIKGDSIEARLTGSLRFRIGTQELTLDAMSEGPNALFIVFKDQTSGRTTYAPARFLSAAAPTDGKVVLDFNKAFNPPCAFSPHTLCPLPPRQNQLPVEIAAGELLYVADVPDSQE